MAPLSGAVMPWYAAHVKTFLALLIEQAEKEQCAGSAQWHNPFDYDDSINYDKKLPPGLRCFLGRRRAWLNCPIYFEDNGVFQRFEELMLERKYTGRLYDLLECCDPVSQLKCVWLKFARTKGWHTLSPTGQRQAFHQFLNANIVNSSFTTEERDHLLGIIFEEHQ